MIFILDNYDSFVFNLARYLEELGEETVVSRNDAMTTDEALSLEPTHIVISPGPCTPRQAGIANDLVRAAVGKVPVLGVCLGHQCIGEVFGGRVIRAARPVHGKVSAVHHVGCGLFGGLPSPLRATRYHSLVLDSGAVPAELEVLAWTEDDVVMAVRHRAMPVWGVQFHPEAVLTEHGHALLNNFLALGRGQPPPGLAAGLPEPEMASTAGPGR